MRATWKLVLGCVVVLFCATSAFAAANRSIASGTFVIELDGKPAGGSSEVSGGFAVGNVVNDLVGGTYYVKKHLEDPPGYKEIGIKFGTGMSSAFYQAIKDALNGQGTAHNGSITLMNGTKPVRRLDFSNAYITEFTIPAADASSKDALKFEVVFSPASTQESKKVGAPKSLVCSVKQTLLANFRFDISGLASSKFATVGPIDIQIPAGSTGGSNDACLHCPPTVVINFPDVDFTILESDAQPVIDWYTDFVVNGNNDDSSEKTGTLDFLSLNFQSVLFEIKLFHAGITQVAHPPAATDKLPQATAHLYAEAISFNSIGAACN